MDSIIEPYQANTVSTFTTEQHIMITAKPSEVLYGKMSELVNISKDNEIAIPTMKTKSGDWLAEKATHFRYSFNPKKTFQPHSLLYSGESAINPVHYGNDRDEIAYVIVDSNA
jgi:hypothetical protein